jgi:hypothetical protein
MTTIKLPTAVRHQALYKMSAPRAWPKWPARSTGWRWRPRMS